MFFLEMNDYARLYCMGWAQTASGSRFEVVFHPKRSTPAFIAAQLRELADHIDPPAPGDAKIVDAEVVEPLRLSAPTGESP